MERKPIFVLHCEHTAVDLFVGAGGLAIGGSRAGFRNLAVIDWNHHACETIRVNQSSGFALIRNWPLHEQDVARFDFAHLAGKVERLTGGPPCQPFSLGGKHRAHLDARDMFPQAIRAVREMAPKAFVFENVKGLTRKTFSDYLPYIQLQLRNPEFMVLEGESWTNHLRRLKECEAGGQSSGLRYDLHMKVLDAADYGVPQRRQRIFLVGFRSDLGVEWHFPEPTHSQDALLWAKQSGDYWRRHQIPEGEREEGRGLSRRTGRLKEKPAELPWRTVRDAIFDLPDPELRPEAAANIRDHLFRAGAKSYPGHTGSPLDEPSKTIKAGAHGVPGGENMLRRPDGSVRYFTVREAARLQTFPDDMILSGSWTQMMKQLGNAVPCKLAEILLKLVSEKLHQAEKRCHRSDVAA